MKKSRDLEVENMKMSLELGSMQDDLLSMQGLVTEIENILGEIKSHYSDRHEVYNLVCHGQEVIKAWKVVR